MSYPLNDQIEAALVAVVDGAICAYNTAHPSATVSAQVVTGKGATDKTLPIVVCAVDGDGEEDPKGTGNLMVRFEVDVRSSMTDETQAQDDALINVVHGAIIVQDLPGSINSAAVIAGIPITVFPMGFQFEAPTSGKDEVGAWIDTARGRLYVCGSVIAP
jgi:hypothetical protein